MMVITGVRACDSPMSDKPIKITKWMIFRRRMLDGLRFRVSRFRTWWKHVTESRRALKSPQTLTLSDRRLTGGGEPADRNDALIHIGGGNRQEVGSGTGTTRRDVRRPPRRPIDLIRTAGTRKTGVINVAETKQTCPACTAEVLAGEPTATCRTNPDHVIHARCVALVKNICPICKGRVA